MARTEIQITSKYTDNNMQQNVCPESLNISSHRSFSKGKRFCNSMLSSGYSTILIWQSLDILEEGGGSKVLWNDSNLYNFGMVLYSGDSVMNTNHHENLKSNMVFQEHM